MEQTRDARRGTGRTTNNFSSVKRKIKQSEGKLNNGGVKTMARLGKASSRCYEDCKMTCLMSDVDVHGDDNVSPCNIKKIKLHKKIVNACNSVDHSPVPQKLRLGIGFSDRTLFSNLIVLAKC